MRIVLKSKVKGNYKAVMNAFDRKLFEALKPPIGQMDIVAFTGSKKGDRVHLRFVSPMKAEWISDITEDGSNDNQTWFVDEGTTLPWPLHYWRHKHIVEKVDENYAMVIDDMTYKAKNPLLTLLMYPALYLSFFPRKKIYKDYFEKLDL